MDISIIIVSYNVHYFLEQCILSVLAASKNIETEIIVIDNASNDDSCQLITTKFPEVTLVQNKINVGFSKANNQGVKIAKGEFVLILNPDTVIAEDTLEKILNFAKTTKNLGALGVKLIDGTGTFLPESKRGIPTPKVSFHKLLGFSKKQIGKYYAAHLSEDELGSIEILVGAFIFMKHAVFTEVNGFDEAYFMYGEDIDLSYKITQKGYQNYYYPLTQVIHYKGESTLKDVKYLTHFYKAMKIFYATHFKSTKLYDFLMYFGVSFWYTLKFFKLKYSFTKEKSIKNVLYLGRNKHIISYLETMCFYVESCIISDVLKIKETIQKSNIEMLVLDNEILTNKQIITFLQQLHSEEIIFKIHPKNTNFLIGSNSSFEQGDIIIFQS